MRSIIHGFQSILFLICLANLNNQAQAQCSCNTYDDDFDIETSSGETADDYDAFDGETVLINYDFTIDIDFTINASLIAVVPGVTIFVQSPNTLTITGGSTLTANTNLWDGIRVDDGASIIINGASIISNAFTGVWIDNNGSNPANFDITDNSFFCNNDIGLYIDGFSGGLHPGFIEETEFCASELIEPLSGLGTAGILVRDFLTTNYVVIGDGEAYSGLSDYNFFHHLQNGILANKASVTIQNNLFENIRTSSYTGCAIKAESEINYPVILTVGETFVAPTSISNAIENCDYGVSAETAYAVNIYSNRFGVSSASPEILRNGIDIRNCAYNHFIENNTFINNDRFAIFMTNNSFADIDLLNNTISSSLSLTTSYVRTGIYVSNSTPVSTEIHIEQNDISGIQTGIFIRNISDYAEIRLNEIDFDFPGGTNEARGILVENCYDILVEENYPINGNCSPTCTDNEVRGIEIQSSEDFRCFKNEINDCAYGILIFEDNEGGNLVCNTLTDCRYGFGLKSLGAPALLGPVHGGLTAADPYPSDNSWYPSTGSPTTWSNRTIAFGSPITYGPDIEWWYRDSGGNEFDMEDGAVLLNTASGMSVVVDPIVPIPILVDPCSFDMPYENINSSLNDDFRIAETSNYKSYFDKISSLIDSNLLENEVWYFLMKRGLNIVYSDNTLLTIEEKNYLLELLNFTSIIQQYELFLEINNRNTDSAAYLLANLAEPHVFDQNLSKVLNIYLSSTDSSGILSLTESDSLELLEVALKTAFEGGIAVHIARGMLDTIISFNSEVPENKMIQSTTPIIYPNPSTDVIYISYPSNVENLHVKILDLFGRIIYSEIISCTNDVPSEVSLGQFDQGCYLIHLTDNKNIQFSEILIKI